MKTCKNCFHYNVCGSASVYTEAKLCKQFVTLNDILYGPALKELQENFAESQKMNEQYEAKLMRCDITIRDMKRELKLLRIIKQTLEMTSGMTFDI